jgi:hypothetical protein
MHSDEEMKNMVKDWFRGQAADCYDAGIHKLVTQYKCLNCHGDYVEKLCKVCTKDSSFFCYSFIILIKWPLRSG